MIKVLAPAGGSDPRPLRPMEAGYILLGESD